MVNCADDFVILTRGRARQALQITRKAVDALGLTLNEQKTRIVDVDQENFEFLGYEFGWEYYRKSGDRYLAAQPSKTSTARLKRKVKRWLKQNPLPWERITARLNHMLEGWANYFSYGTRTLAYRAIANYVADRAAAVLAKRHKSTTSRGRRWSDDKVFGRMGVTRLRTLHVQMI